MALDSALLCRPTDGLILPGKRRFFPQKIPNSHHQLRHYISTPDPDRIYVAVDRLVYIIHVSSRKREVIAITPFDPKCLAAGYGWIVVGGSEHGDCAVIRLANSEATENVFTETNAAAGVDATLPLHLDSPFGRGSQAAVEEPAAREPEDPGDQSMHRVRILEFGGSIVNSVTIHRLPGDGIFADEDVAVFSNNDTTVTVYSLTRRAILETIRHPICMNYAIISPDSKVLAAVGDENTVYFYRLVRCPKKSTHYPHEDRTLVGWEWPLIKCVELELDARFDDRCCFTVAFSPSSHLCAVGSQSGIITIFDMNIILELDDESKEGEDPVLCVFRSSRSYFDGGAVRCMTFSPEPWDLLIWLEDHGRAGVADVRQAFTRRQVITLDIEDEDLKYEKIEDMAGSRIPREWHGESEPRESGPPRYDDTSLGAGSHVRRPHVLNTTASQSRSRLAESRAQRDNLIHDLTERERQIIDFLNTARWASSIEEGPPSRIPRLSAIQSDLRRTAHELTGRHSPNHPSRPTTPPSRYIDALQDFIRERYLHRQVQQPRRRSSVVLSHTNPDSLPEDFPRSRFGRPYPTITLRWSTSPAEIAPTSDPSSHTGGLSDGGPVSQSDDNETTAPPESSAHTYDRLGLAQNLPHDSLSQEITNSSLQRQRSRRSRSIPRWQQQQSGQNGQASQRSLSPGTRTALASAEDRAERQSNVEEGYRASQWEQQYRQHFLGFEPNQSPRWMRNMMSEIPDLSMRPPERDQERGIGTAGVGFGQDGRTLYIGSVEGIFEYQLNIQDRKTFPVTSYR